MARRCCEVSAALFLLVAAATACAKAVECASSTHVISGSVGRISLRIGVPLLMLPLLVLCCCAYAAYMSSRQASAMSACPALARAFMTVPKEMESGRCNRYPDS